MISESYAITTTPLSHAVLAALFKAVGEIGYTIIASAPAWTMALICWIWRWAFAPATFTLRSILSS